MTWAPAEPTAGFDVLATDRAPGSKVQRSLATVVIGGLITATALTLLLSRLFGLAAADQTAPQRPSVSYRACY